MYLGRRSATAFTEIPRCSRLPCHAPIDRSEFSVNGRKFWLPSQVARQRRRLQPQPDARKSKHGSKKDPLLSLREFALMVSLLRPQKVLKRFPQIVPEPEWKGATATGFMAIICDFQFTPERPSTTLTNSAPPFIARCFRHFHCFRST